MMSDMSPSSSPSLSRRAVFTGLGVLSPIGCDPDTFWQALVAGTSGVRRIQAFDPAALPCHLGGEVTDYDAKKYIPATNREVRKTLNKMARTVQMGFTTAVKAWEDAQGPQKGQIDPYRFGVEYGCVMVATELEDLVGGGQVSRSDKPGVVNLDAWGRDGLRKVPPQWMLKYLPNMSACHASIYVDAQGPNNTITAGDVAGSLALGEAYRIIARNLADAFLVGGCDSRINPVSFSRHNSFQPLTRHNELGAKAIRPFAADRDGFVIGEGAAVFVLEELEFAQKRGAKIDAELVGFASGFDRGLKGDVLTAVIRRALQQANITPNDVDHVNAGASGSKILDLWEAKAIADVFGTNIPVFAPKGHFGNTGAASGLIELAASVLALKHRALPGTLNCENRDPDCPVAVHTGKPRAVTKPFALKVSYTDMGQCAAVVVKQWS